MTVSPSTAQRASRYAWYILGLLTVINTVNYFDRTMVNGMYDAMRSRYGLSDTQIGALGGVFFVVHGVTTLPFGWIADHFDRRKVIAFGVITWSLATLGTAHAFGFWTLLLMRGLVGVGEAAYGPVSNSLLAESFPPEAKAKTLGIYNAGMFVGACLGLLAGVRLGWPQAFHVIALPGVILGIVALYLKVPAVRVDAPRKTVSMRALLSDGARALRPSTLRWMLWAGIAVSFTAGGYLAWFVDFIKVVHGVTPEEATKHLFLVVVTAGPAGVVLGGVLGDWLHRRRRDGRLLAIALGFLIAIPAAVGTIYAKFGALWFVSAWVLNFALPFYHGPMAAVIDDVVDDEQASTAQAMFSALLHLIGTGTGALVVGALNKPIGPQLAMMVPTAMIVVAIPITLAACKFVGGDTDAKLARAKAGLRPAP